jgi:hypothetical protein
VIHSGFDIIDFDRAVSVGMMVFGGDLAENKVVGQADQAVSENYIKLR